MSVFSSDSFDNHEQVIFGSDPETGLQAIIAIHSTAFGPGAGGCRMWPYASEQEAITDVLRLSRGMSYKNAMAGLALGGGKSVIIGDAKKDKTPELMRAFGRFVHQAGGRYITAEDVGMSVRDMEEVGTQTPYVAGLDSGETASGDPSPYTAHGVFFGIKAAVKHAFGEDSVKGLRIAVQGLGHVGYNLCRELAADGATLLVADINEENARRAVDEFGATAVDPAVIALAKADIYAPCALGATINDETVDRIPVKIIAGSANNQLATDHHGVRLAERGILYAPDYVINAGGIMNVANEVAKRKVSHEQAWQDVERIYATLTAIFARARETGEPTSAIADEMARQKIAAAKAVKTGKSQAA